MCNRVKVKGFIEEYRVMRMSESGFASLLVYVVMHSVIYPVISCADVLKTSWNIITVSDFIDIFLILFPVTICTFIRCNKRFGHQRNET